MKKNLNASILFLFLIFGLPVVSFATHPPHFGSDVFNGILTQTVACAEKADCVGIDNTPSQAFSQFTSTINSDRRTSIDTSYLRSTDIRWRK